MSYFLGIDGGGSQTRAVVIDDSLRFYGRGTAPGSNFHKVGLAPAAMHCAAAAAAAIADTARVDPGFNVSAIAAWGFGLAGVRRDADAAAMREQLQDLPGGAPWLLDTDAAAAHSGAFAGSGGIVLINGTGAICLGIDPQRERFYADGWGHIMGDEGSGYWLGVEALRAVCRAADGRGPRTTMSAPVLDALNLPDLDALVRFVYSPECTTETIARLARIVLNAADAGGSIAIEIRDRAVAHLAASVTAVARQYLLYAQARAAQVASAPVDLQIALCGGLFEDDYFRASVGYQIGEHMVEIKRDFLPLASWRVIRPQHDAAVGAAMLASRLV